MLATRNTNLGQLRVKDAKSVAATWHTIVNNQTYEHCLGVVAKHLRPKLYVLAHFR